MTSGYPGNFMKKVATEGMSPMSIGVNENKTHRYDGDNL